MIWLCIYLIGIVISYYAYRYFDRLNNQNNDWEFVSARLVLSLLSFFGLGMMVIFLLLYTIVIFIKGKLPKDPPKWL